MRLRFAEPEFEATQPPPMKLVFLKMAIATPIAVAFVWAGVTLLKVL